MGQERGRTVYSMRLGDWCRNRANIVNGEGRKTDEAVVFSALVIKTELGHLAEDRCVCATHIGSCSAILVFSLKVNNVNSHLVTDKSPFILSIEKTNIRGYI